MSDALGSISSNPVSISEGISYTDNISSASDVDYFKLPASLFNVPSQIDVSFGGSFSSVNDLFSVSIVDQSDTVIATTSTGVATTLSAAVSSGSAYYIKVAKADSLDTSDYSISYDAIETTESELSSSGASNGSIQSSNYLIDGTSFKGTLLSASNMWCISFTNFLENSPESYPWASQPPTPSATTIRSSCTNQASSPSLCRLSGCGMLLEP